MTELIVIRHGETDWNRQHRFQGQIDVPLNALGLEQARRLGQRLAQEPVDRVIVSDLQRARQTAQGLAEAPGRRLQIEPLWREQGFGLLEGLDVPTIRSQHADLWTQWLRHDADYALPQGGESNVAFHARVLQALQALLAEHAGARVAVVTHGGVLDMLWRHAQGLPLSGPRECEIPNTGINRMRWTDGRLQITDWGDAAHLEGLPPQPSTVQARVARQDLDSSAP
jgi:probable phosphoglycerate mutase